MRWVFSTNFRLLYPQEKPATIVQESGWGGGFCLERTVASYRIPWLESSALSESLYRLSYRTVTLPFNLLKHNIHCNIQKTNEYNLLKSI